MESPELSTGLCNGERSSEEHEVEKTIFRLIVAGVAPTVVAAFGTIGNVISGLVLGRPQMKSSLCCLLLGLTLCDTILIICTILIMGLEPIFNHFQIAKYYVNHIIPSLVPYLYPLGMTAHTGSVYFTLAVTLERFIVVCYPLEARIFCTWNRACYYSAILFTFSILYNLPRWWEFHVVEVNSSLNSSDIYLDAIMTEFRCGASYIKFYVLWANFVVLYLIPMLALIIINIIIYLEIRKMNQRRQVLSKYQNRENSLTVMLLMVVLFFLVCNILPLVNNFMESVDSDLSSEMIDLSNFIITVNSSVNCIIYCIFGEKFRRQLVKTCPCFHFVFPKPLPKHSSTLNTNPISYNQNQQQQQQAAI